MVEVTNLKADELRNLKSKEFVSVLRSSSSSGLDFSTILDRSKESRRDFGQLLALK